MRPETPGISRLSKGESMQLKRTCAASIAAILTLSLIGCGTNPIDILNLAVGALEVALPLIGPAAGVDPAITSAVETYLGSASQAITQASDILSSPGLTDAQKEAAITAAFAGIAAPIVPAKYAALASAIQQVAQYIGKFLATLPAPTAAHAMTEAATTVHVPGSSDMAKLRGIKARAEGVHSKVKR